MARDETNLRLSRVKRAIAYTLPAIAVVVYFSGRMQTDPQSVHDLVIQRLRDYFPKAELREIDGDVNIFHADGRRQHLALAALEAACADKPRKCADSIDDALIDLIDRLEGRKPLVDPPKPAASTVPGVIPR